MDRKQGQANASQGAGKANSLPAPPANTLTSQAGVFTRRDRLPQTSLICPRCRQAATQPEVLRSCPKVLGTAMPHTLVDGDESPEGALGTAGGWGQGSGYGWGERGGPGGWERGCSGAEHRDREMQVREQRKPPLRAIGPAFKLSPLQPQELRCRKAGCPGGQGTGDHVTLRSGSASRLCGAHGSGSRRSPLQATRW